jgi:tetratricopeptide (TPR) repeat protein
MEPRSKLRHIACLFGLFWLAAQPAMAQDEAAQAAATAPLSQVEQWYRAGQFQQAAEQGLQDLLLQPWNHELRFMVADSLQRSGQLDPAIMQFEALDGTPLAASAALRLNALRSNKGGAIDGERYPRVTLPNAAPTRAAGAARALPQATSAVSATATAATVAESATQLAQLENFTTPPKTKPGSTLRARVVLPKKSPALQKIDDLAAKGDYAAVARDGLLLLEQEKNNPELRLLVANSLAWTGFLDQAVQQYQLLLNGPLAQDASIGLANVYRWRGDDAQALPLYQAVLAKSPKNEGALEGLRLAQRELRPKTTFSFGAASDSADARRRFVTLNQSFRDKTGKHAFEIELGAANDSLPTLRENQRDVTLRYQALGLPWQPQLELSGEGKPYNSYYGNVRFHIASGQNYLELGTLNWGKLASNAKALQIDLAARHAGLALEGKNRFGQFSGKIDYYDISDGNEILSSNVRFVPALRPLGSHFKLFTGIETRDARRAALNGSYWAPVDGFGSVFVGLQTDWGGADWNLYGAGQVGARLSGEAGNSWSISGGGKRWLGPDWAIGLNLFKLASRRDNARYSAQAFNVSVEKLWN